MRTSGSTHHTLPGTACVIGMMPRSSDQCETCAKHDTSQNGWSEMTETHVTNRRMNANCGAESSDSRDR